MTSYLATIRYEADNKQEADEVSASMVRLFAGWNASVVSVEPDEPEFCEHEPYRDDIPGEPYGAVAVRAMRVLRCRKCPAVSVTWTGFEPPPLSPWQLDPSTPPVPAQSLSPALLDELRQMMREEAHAAVESHESEHRVQGLRRPDYQRALEEIAKFCGHVNDDGSELRWGEHLHNPGDGGHQLCGRCAAFRALAL